MKSAGIAYFGRALAATAVALVVCAAATAGELLLADGTRAEAELVAESDGGKVAFDVGGTRLSPDGRDLVRWGAFVSPTESMLAVLEGGDLLTFSDVAVDGDALRLQSEPFGEARVPIAAVRGLLFQPPVEALERDRLVDELARWENTSGGADKEATHRAILDNGDVVVGKLATLAAEELEIETAAGKLALPIERVRAVAFAAARSAAAKRGLRFVVGAIDGSRITATEIKTTDAGIALKTAWGGELSLARDQVAAIQTLGGRATYVSDIAASGYKHVPYFATTWPLSGDRNVAGGRLRASGREYLKGLGMHSAASATYVLDKLYRRFEAELAIDECVFGEAAAGDRNRRSPRGSVIFRVYADGGDGKWQLRHTSETIRGGDKPVAVSVDLAGAKRLSLIVDFADRADEWDRADWLDARLVE